MQRITVQAHKYSGFSIVECMVAFLIICLGLLGAAVLQAELSKSASASTFHIAAVNYSKELYSRMVADYNNLGCYAYPTTGTCSSSTRDQTVADVSAWANAVSSAIPNSSIAVAADPTTGKGTITISWTLHGDSQTYVMPFAVDTAL